MQEMSQAGRLVLALRKMQKGQIVNRTRGAGSVGPLLVTLVGLFTSMAL
jgi:hypothetical protein